MKINSRRFFYVIFFISLLFLFSSVNGKEQTIQEKPPIKIILNDWASQQILSYIAGYIYTEMGFKIEYKILSTDAQWHEIGEKEVNVQVEVWEGSMSDEYQNLLNRKLIVDAGTYSAITREGWWYPLYVEKLCPGLPDWTALKKCYSIFATPASKPYGLYINGPWEKSDQNRIDALGLKFKILNLRNGDEIFQKVDAAYKKKQPILIYNWIPNYVESVYKGKFVNFPEYSVECAKDPKWGINPNKTNDCGEPKKAWLKKIVSADFPKKWPCAFSVLQKFNFTNKEISNLAKQADYNSIPIKRVALTWYRENKDLWKNWVPKNCQRH